MKNVITYALSFALAFTFTILGIAGYRTAMGHNDHIHLFSDGSASYIADFSCTVDAPFSRSTKDMQEAFDECLRLHKEYQSK